MFTPFRQLKVTAAAVFAAALAAFAPQPAGAQTSTYFAMSVAGVFNNYNDGSRNMELIADNTWQATLYLSARAFNDFKFVANGSYGSDDWGSNDNFTNLPFTGTANNLNFGGNIQHYQLTDGYYVFTFNDATRAYTVDRIYSLSYSNRVRNGGFEIQVADTNLTVDALHWQYFQPDTRGDSWGAASRQNFRSKEGTWMMIIGTDPKFGGIWQDTPGGEGFEYEATGWFWADTAPPFGPWTAEDQGLKIEFFNASFNQIGFVVNNLTSLTSDWQQFSVSGIAPPDTAWVRTVVYANNSGDAGSLQFDEITLTERPPTEQNFGTMGGFSYTGAYAHAGWSIAGGSTLIDPDTGTNDIGSANSLIYSGVSIKLEPDGHVLSPPISGGVGRVVYQFRNGSTNEVETTNAVSMVVETSPQGTTWFTALTLTNVLNLTYQERSVRIPDGIQHPFVRIRHDGGAEALLIDDVRLLKAEPVVRYQDFETFTNQAVNGCYTVDDWTLCTGRVITAGGYDGYTALIAAAPNTNNYLQSPLFTNGFGSISFYYARGTNGGGPARLLLQSSPDGVNWTTFDTVEDIFSGSFSQYRKFFFKPDSAYVRFLNFPVIVTGGATVLIDEGFAGGHQVPPSGWTFSGMSSYTTTSSSGDEPPSLKFDNTNDKVESPLLNNPTNVTFWILGRSISAANSLKIEYTENDSTWTEIATITGIGANQNLVPSYPLPMSAIRVRWTYDKPSGGNLAFDDVLIEGFSGGGPAVPQDVLLDNISIEQAVEYRTQNFDDWPRGSGYIDSDFQGWSIGNTLLDSQEAYAYAGQSARMNQDAGPFVQSHEFPGGIGPVSFKYRVWDPSPTAQFVMEYSTNGGSSWITMETFSTTATTYQDYNEYYNITNAAIIRWRKTSGERVYLDQIVISKPLPPADVQISSFIDPSAPFTNDAVSIGAVIFSVNGATGITPTAFYRIGTAGVFSASAMTLVDYGTYQITSAIPPQPAGTVVQYYFSVAFGGPGASSPKLFPAGGSADPLQYAIPRAKPGQVWINEVNSFVFLGSVGQFIELAGPAGFDLSGWAVEIRSGAINEGLPYLLGRYNIAAPTTLPADTPDFGFFVIGEDGSSISFTPVAERDMVLTNDMSNINPLGITLLNEAGGIEHIVSFGAVMNNHEFAGVSDNSLFVDESLSLTGTGSNGVDFVWNQDIADTPGSMNAGQTLGDVVIEVMDPPDLYVVAISNGNVYVRSTGNTNGWNAIPYQTASLNTAPQLWQPVTPYSSSANGSTNQIWFALPSSSNLIFRVRYTAP